MGSPEGIILEQERIEHFNRTGMYSSDDYIKKRGNGGSTSYYKLPANATELRHLIRHKKMSHPIGEAFCALYRLSDNGEYERNLQKAKFYIECELEDFKNEQK